MSGQKEKRGPFGGLEDQGEYSQWLPQVLTTKAVLGHQLKVWPPEKQAADFVAWGATTGAINGPCFS